MESHAQLVSAREEIAAASERADAADAEAATALARAHIAEANAAAAAERAERVELRAKAAESDADVSRERALTAEAEMAAAREAAEEQERMRRDAEAREEALKSTLRATRDRLGDEWKEEIRPVGSLPSPPSSPPLWHEVKSGAPTTAAVQGGGEARQRHQMRMRMMVMGTRRGGENVDDGTADRNMDVSGDERAWWTEGRGVRRRRRRLGRSLGAANRPAVLAAARELRKQSGTG